MKLREQLGYLAAVACLGSGLVAAYRFRPPGPKEDPVFRALQQEEASLAGFGRQTVARLREERDALARRVTAPPLAELERAAGPRWTWTEVNDGRYAVTCRGEDAGDWPALLAGLVALERQPGVFLESVEFSGDGRRLAAARLTVRVRAKAGETKGKPS